MKIRPVVVEFYHADRRTDRHMTKLTVGFRNFANAPTDPGTKHVVLGQTSRKMGHGRT
jgi:hypothetical protein